MIGMDRMLALRRGRNAIEEEEEYDLEEAQREKPEGKVSINLDLQSSSRALGGWSPRNRALIVMDDIASVIEQTVEATVASEPAGGISFGGTLLFKIANLSTDPAGDDCGRVLMISKQARSIPESAIADIVRTILTDLDVQEVLILDALSRASFVYDSAEAGIRALSTISSLSLSSSSSIERDELFPVLEIGNVVTGLTGALVSACELRSLPARAYLCPRDAAFDTAAARQLEALLPRIGDLFLRSLLSVPSFPVPSRELYLRIYKNDIFLLNTESLYV